MSNQRMRLKKDIVIPAGTIMTSVAEWTCHYAQDCYGVIVGLTDDSCGDFIYAVDPLDKKISDWFGRVEDGVNE